MSDLCLTILCPSAIDERLLDALLMAGEVEVFTSARASAHGLDHHRLSTSEQVLGLAIMTQVQALLRTEHRDTVLASLASQFAGAGLRYWITPVVAAGEFI